MKRKNNLLRVIIYMVVLGVFIFFENKLYRQYRAEKKVADYVKEQKTQEIENSFLLRKKYFYTDNEYLKNFKKLVEKSSKKGED
ncbi:MULTISPECIES: hypothetical protein [unclassified Fusobacterium]|uniref:hypothetical protein n=1 Tax=unclassified Fusobacterium TaxID=2648384 RepID=UPI0025BF48B3|nr:hypothetical protein [Fusobacterium sp.]